MQEPADAEEQEKQPANANVPRCQRRIGWDAATELRTDQHQAAAQDQTKSDRVSNDIGREREQVTTPFED
jgi:hypothetical protein